MGSLGVAPPSPRVLLSDDEPLLRVGAALLLGQADDIEVAAEAADGAEAIEVVRSQPIDVALVDIRVPNVDGLTAAEEIGRIAPKVRVIMLTTFGEEANVVRALRTGAAGFLLKDTEPARILHASHLTAAMVKASGRRSNVLAGLSRCRRESPAVTLVR